MGEYIANWNSSYITRGLFLNKYESRFIDVDTEMYHALKIIFQLKIIFR